MSVCEWCGPLSDKSLTGGGQEGPVCWPCCQQTGWGLYRSPHRHLWPTGGRGFSKQYCRKAVANSLSLGMTFCQVCLHSFHTFNRLYNRNVLEVGVEDMLACLWVYTRARYRVRERGGSYATEVRESLSPRESLSRNKGTCHWEAWKRMPRRMPESAKAKPQRVNEGDDALTMVIQKTER